MSEVIAVLDIGITNLKLLLIDRSGQVLSSSKADNVPLQAPPYLHMNVGRIWNWLLRSLSEAADRYTIEAIVPCTHGSAVALIDEAGLTLPIMHYEAQPPLVVTDAYASMQPEFDEVLSPLNPASMTLAQQLLWQQMRHPKEFGRAEQLLFYPQYWAWRLCGVAATEITSLGAQTHLWAPQRNDYSSLVEAQGWQSLFPPLHQAWEPLGPVLSELSQRTGLAPDTPVLCGIHDSNANYLRYLAAGWENFSLMSTGTWIINFNSGFDPADLSAEFDTNTNCDVYGRPVSCSRFMGGREYALLAGNASSATAEPEDIENIIADDVMALPSFTDSGGPFPDTGGKGHITGPELTEPEERKALATLYTALMARTALAYIGTDNPIIIDGAFASNKLFCRLTAALHPDREVWAAEQADGTAQGAALLWEIEKRDQVELELQQVEPVEIDGLDDYVARWLAAAATQE